MTRKATFIAVLATVVMVMLTGCAPRTPGKNQQIAGEYNSTKLVEKNTEITNLEKEAETSVTAISDLTKQNEDLTSENEELKEKVAELEAAANKDPDTKDTEIKNLTEENENLKKQVENLEATAIEQAKQSEAKDAEIKNLKEENESLKKQIADLEEAAKKQETSGTVESTEKVISKEQENIKVSALYHNSEIPLYVATEANRADSINNAKVITTKDARGNDIRDRNLSLSISGVSVDKVYVDDDGLKEIEGLTYNSVDNTYRAPYYMPGAGQYTFLIQTVNGTHYYVTVVY